ncbi:hypothetical protein OIU78_006771 [Salix suchowensis]|nr:hypothetical protein OIU78_006771 [Salix suchowensis]
MNRLESQENSAQPVRIREHLQYAMFCLLVVMCFGDNVDETQIKQIEEALGGTLPASFYMRALILPQLPWNGSWQIWSNTRKIQDKLFMEIKGVVGNGDQEEVSESDLRRMPYLKAVILEGLRRHPPARLLVPHAVREDVVFNNEYLIPENAAINFLVAELGWDPKVWEDPLAFKPERFLNHDNGIGQEFDITGSREIKMMPFGAGRRICPGYQLAMLHMEYYVANLILKFECKSVDGGDVDLSEKVERTMMMKNPLQVHLSRR